MSHSNSLCVGSDRRLIDAHYSLACGIEGCGIFALQSKINHDCSPNCEARSCTFRSACVEVVAVRPVAVGDEICIRFRFRWIGLVDLRSSFAT